MEASTSKKRVGLSTPVTASKKKKGDPKTTTTSYVEVSSATELASKLGALGAKRVGLLCRDRLGTTRLEGEMFSVSELKDSHMNWVTAEAPEFETRGIYYDVK